MKHKLLHLSIWTLLATLGWVNNTTAQAVSDTTWIKGIVIVKNKDAKGKSSYKIYEDTAYQRAKLKKNLHTRWFVFDIGFNNFMDRSDYNGANYLSYYVTPNMAQGEDIWNKRFDYSAAGLNTFAPRNASAPLTPSEFKLITGKSINFNIWLMTQRLNIYKHKLNLQYAIGVEMNSYRYARNITYEPGYPTKIVRDTVNFSKNKLFAQYLSVPVMLNYTSNPARPNRAFKMSFGVMGGYLIKARTKQISEERGKIRRSDDFNLNKWRLALTGEVGYGPVKLYGNFGLTPLHDYGLEQYPFSVGIRLNSF